MVRLDLDLHPKMHTSPRLRLLGSVKRDFEFHRRLATSVDGRSQSAAKAQRALTLRFLLGLPPIFHINFGALAEVNAACRLI